MKKILIINGPNLNFLGKREPGVYGSDTLESINRWLLSELSGEAVTLDFFQSNSEGDLIDKLQLSDDYDAVVINPGAYSHYSIALRDAIASITLPVFEVHISNIAAREEFRNKSVVSAVCRGVISGLGKYGYLAAVRAAIYLSKEQKNDQV